MSKITAEYRMNLDNKINKIKYFFMTVHAVNTNM